MMLDPEFRFYLACALIALTALAALAWLWLRRRNSWERRDTRARDRLAERHRLRDEAAAARDR